MKLIRMLTVGALLLGGVLMGPASTQGAESKTRVLLVVGGHDFETNAFYTMFKADPAITVDIVEHPAAYPKWKDAASKFDVIVLYDFYQKITDEAKADLLAYLKAGKGLVSLHHSIANFQKWPEYEEIIGGRYYLEKTVVNGVTKERSTWKHDVLIKANVVDTQHPVMRGVQPEFVIHDEAYGKYDMSPKSHPLITTDEPLCAKNVAWAKTYDQARIVYIALGHDHFAYENSNFKRMVSNAIQWTAKKD